MRSCPQSPQRFSPPLPPSAAGGVERPAGSVAAYQARLAAMGALVMVMLTQASQVVRRIGPAVAARLDVVGYAGPIRAAWDRASVAIAAQDGSAQRPPFPGAIVRVGHAARP